MGHIVTPTRLRTLVSILITIPLGFGLKYYSGPGDVWCNLHGAGVVYELFWCLVGFFALPHRKHIPAIAITVFAVTCTLEVMQLYHHPWLEAIRGYKIGVWLIGNGFDWLDFPHYGLGCAIGWLILRILCRPLYAVR
jgi:hypothetical protein